MCVFLFLCVVVSCNPIFFAHNAILLAINPKYFVGWRWEGSSKTKKGRKKANAKRGENHFRETFIMQTERSEHTQNTPNDALDVPFFPSHPKNNNNNKRIHRPVVSKV